MKIACLDELLVVSLTQYAELMGKAFPVTPRLEIHDDTNFWALAELKEDEFVIRVGGGVVPALTSLWDDAFNDSDFITGVRSPFDAGKADTIHVSLVWLMFHEMQHFELGHFDIVGRSFLSETAHGKRFALGSRGTTKPSLLGGLDDAIKPKIEPCLELQADHDAAELVLDAYSADEWSSLRARIAAITAMIMLIEREDSKLTQDHSSHPKAATRIFQLLGHVMEMPLISAQRKAVLSGADRIDPSHLPSDEEQSAFNREVAIPAFFDAVNLARIAGADSIRIDLGEAADFFRDVQIAKMGDVSTFKNLRTEGAKQWADLVWINEKILALQRLK